MKRVLIVEDHALFRECLALMFGSEIGWENVQTETAAGARSILAARTGGAYLPIVDLDLPGEDAVELLEELREDVGDAPVVAFTGSRDPGTRDRAIQAGATEVLSLQEPVDLFVTAARLLAEGPASGNEAPAPRAGSNE